MTNTTPIQTTADYQVNFHVFAGDTLAVGQPEPSSFTYARLREEAMAAHERADMLITHDNAPHLAEFVVNVLPKFAEAYAKNVWQFDLAKLGVCKLTPWVLDSSETAEEQPTTDHYHLCMLFSLTERTAQDVSDMTGESRVGPEGLVPGDVVFLHPRRAEVQHIPSTLLGRHYDSQIIRPSEGMVIAYPSYLEPKMASGPDNIHPLVLVGVKFILQEESV
jgi:hypothetical protein